jgi:predicted PurR-regulated permease PerM
MDKKKLQLYFFLALLIAVLGLTIWIFLPYLSILALAAILAVALYPLYERILKFVCGYRRAAALLTIGIAGILILAPVVFFGFRILQESLDLYARLSSQTDTYTRAFASVTAFLNQYLPGFELNFGSFASQILSWVAKNLGSVFSGTVQTVFGLFVGLVALFYFLVDGHRFVAAFIELSPLADTYDRKILERLSNAVNSVLRGSLLIAIIQGIIFGFGLWLFGMPDPTLWGSCAAVASLIPGIGTSLISIPSIIYLYSTGNPWQAAGLLAWSATAVGMVDNLIGPYLIGRGVRIHPFPILIAVLGGISYFGPLGFLFGPLVLSLLYGLVEIYRLLVLHKTERKTGQR